MYNLFKKPAKLKMIRVGASSSSTALIDDVINVIDFSASIK